jgi:hypothetical protein
MMTVPIKIRSTVHVGAPQALFHLPAGSSWYQASRDGKRFLVSVLSGSEGTELTTPITVITNWQVSLKK